MLYLHIGSGKAGSTSIQNFLTNCRRDLPYRQVEAFGLGNSWKISAAMNTPNSRWYWTEVAKRLSPEAYQDLCETFWDDVRSEVAKAGSRDFIASSEYIFALPEMEREAIADLHRHLVDIFGEVRILIYLRDQIDLVKSLYAQRINGLAQDRFSFEDFVTNLQEHRINLDYADRLKIWGEIFGWENIEATVFDRKNFRNGSLIQDFCARTGIPYDSERFAPKHARKNISPSYPQVVARRYLNALPLGRRARNLADRVIRAIPSRGDFPSDYDDLVLSEVSEGNRWLNTRILPDLSVKLPE